MNTTEQTPQSNKGMGCLNIIILIVAGATILIALSALFSL